MATGFALPFRGLYTKRTRQALFVARWIACQRGSTSIGLEDMLLALVYEDQGSMEQALGRLSYPGGFPKSLKPERHERFFTLDQASGLIREIEGLAARSEPLPDSAEVPMSMQLKKALEAAAATMKRYKGRRVAPLHVLAGILAQPSSSAAEILERAGITGNVIEGAIAEGADRQ